MISLQNLIDMIVTEALEEEQKAKSEAGDKYKEPQDTFRFNFRLIKLPNGNMTGLKIEVLFLAEQPLKPRNNFFYETS